MSERDAPVVIAYRVGELEKAVSAGLKGLSDKFDTFSTKFTPIEDTKLLEKRVTKLEGKDNLKNTLLWVGLVASAIINIVMVARAFGVA